MPKIREVSEDNKAERQAVNSIIQGTASDVVKMAMIGIERAIVLQEKKEASERKERRMRKLTEKEKEKENEEKGKEAAEEENEENEKKRQDEKEKTTRKGKERRTKEEKGKERRIKEGDSPPAHDLDELLAIEEQMMAEAEQEDNDNREREAEKARLKKEERKAEKEKEEAEEKEKKGYSAALLLQIHDELVYEVRDDMIDWIEDVILNNMEGIQIPIPVDDEPKKEEGEAGDSQTRQIVFPVRLFLGSRFGSMRSFPLKPANQEERYHKKSTARSNTNTEAAPPSRGGIGEEQASDMILED